MLLELDPEYFSHFVTNKVGRRRIHEEINNNPTLLVTIGDSWTWGGSIDGTDPRDKNKIDSPKRLISIYGYHLHNSIGNCDWINLGSPGCANRWIVDSALRFEKLAKLTHYKKIIISVGLTEITRDLKEQSLEWSLDTAKNIEQEYFKKLNALNCCNNISVVVARNFTSSFDENIGLLDHHVPMRWIDLNNTHWQQNVKLPNCWTIDFPDHVPYDQKTQILEYMADSEKIIDFLENCPLHFKQDSKHPTEQSHVLWANYLFDYMVKQQII